MWHNAAVRAAVWAHGRTRPFFTECAATGEDPAVLHGSAMPVHSTAQDLFIAY